MYLNMSRHWRESIVSYVQERKTIGHKQQSFIHTHISSSSNLHDMKVRFQERTPSFPIFHPSNLLRDLLRLLPNRQRHGHVRSGFLQRRQARKRRGPTGQRRTRQTAVVSCMMRQTTYRQGSRAAHAVTKEAESTGRPIGK